MEEVEEAVPACYNAILSGALSSVVERFVDIEKAGGPIPPGRTYIGQVLLRHGVSWAREI